MPDRFNYLSESNSAPRVAALPILLGAMALLAVHAALTLPFLTDDALISLRYVDRFLAGQGLTWTAGTPVEGYSNLLWILLTAAVGFLGIDLVFAVRLLGFLCMTGVLCALAYRFRNTAQAPWAFALAATVIVFSAPVAAWTVGGLEQPLVACLSIWAVVLTLRPDDGHLPGLGREAIIGLCLGALCITRPDGPIFTVTTIGGLLIVHRLNRRVWLACARIAAVAGLFFVGQLIFRLSYYGEWVPNTALVKISPSLSHTRDGLVYIGEFLLSMIAALLIAAWHVVTVFRGGTMAERSRVIQILLPIIAWGSYVVFIGGDIFPAWRHGVVLVGLIALLCGESVARISPELATLVSSRSRVAIAASLGIVLLVTNYQVEANRRPFSERWEWDGKAVGEGLKRVFGQSPPTIAVDAAGCVPYWSGFPAIDMLGLNDRHIARTTPTDLGEGRIGHEKGDGVYVLSLKPDMVLFNYDMDIFPVYRSGEELIQTPEFLAMYPICRFMATAREDGRGRKKFYGWVRRDSPSMGYHADELGDVTYPIHFFTGIGNNVAVLGWDGTEHLEVKRNDPATFRYADIAPGKYRVEVAADGPIEVSLVESDTNVPIARGTAPLEIELNNHPNFEHRLAVFDIALSPIDDKAVTIGKVTFVKIEAFGRGAHESQTNE